MEQAEIEARIQLLRQGWGAPARHAAISSSLLRWTGGWYEAYEKMRNGIGQGFTAALVGGRGAGKTQLAVQIMKRATRQECTAKYLEAIDFFMAIKETYRPDSKSCEREVMHAYCKPMLLVIDEFGKRGETPWADNLMFAMLNKRYNAKLDTILIDNRDKTAFTQALGPSLVSRILETGWLIECNWESYR